MPSIPLVPVPGHPGIYRKGNRYVVVYRDRGKQRKKSCRSLTEARDFKSRAHLGTTPGLDSRLLFVKYAGQWLDSYSGRTTNGLRDSTRDSYRDALDRVVIPFFKQEMPTLKLSALSPTDLKAFIAHLAAQDLAAATIRRYFAPLRALVNTAFEDGLISRNPVAGLRVVVPSNGESKPSAPKRLTAEQTRRLLTEIPEAHRDLVYLLATTGIRIGEALALCWRDFDGAVLTISESKTSAGLRTLSLSPEAGRRLVERRSTSTHNRADDPIFAGRGGGPLDAHNWRSHGSSSLLPAAQGSLLPRLTASGMGWRA